MKQGLQNDFAENTFHKIPPFTPVREYFLHKYTRP